MFKYGTIHRVISRTLLFEAESEDTLCLLRQSFNLNLEPSDTFHIDNQNTC